MERAETCYRLHGPIARICDTGSRYGRLDLRAGAPRCVPRMRTYIGVSNDREEKGEREEAACQGQSWRCTPPTPSPRRRPCRHPRPAWLPRGSLAMRSTSSSSCSSPAGSCRIEWSSACPNHPNLPRSRVSLSLNFIVSLSFLSFPSGSWIFDGFRKSITRRSVCRKYVIEKYIKSRKILDRDREWASLSFLFSILAIWP